MGRATTDGEQGLARSGYLASRGGVDACTPDEEAGDGGGDALRRVRRITGEGQKFVDGCLVGRVDAELRGELGDPLHCVHATTVGRPGIVAPRPRHRRGRLTQQSNLEVSVFLV